MQTNRRVERVGLAAFVLAAGTVLTAGPSGCSAKTTAPMPAPTTTTTAQSNAANGMTAFQACDLRTASQDFAAATPNDLNPTRPDFALAYALSTLAVLPEDPAVTAVLGRLGFTGPIDTSMLWGPGGVLAQLATRTATCTSISDYVNSRIPYAPAHASGPSAASVLKDTTLNGNDFVNAAAALSPRIQKIVDVLEQGAGSMTGASVTGGCSVGTFYVQSPELYGLAAFLETFVAAIQAAQGYDWGVPASIFLAPSGQEQALADSLDAHIFHVTNAAAIEAARPLLQHAVLLFQEGLTSVAGMSSRPANSLFKWEDAPPNVVADLQTLAAGLQTLLTMTGLQSLPFFSPSLLMDGRSFFDNPVDMTNAAPAIWSVLTGTNPAGNSYQNLVSTSAGATSQLMPRFSPYPFGSSASGYSLTLSSRWQNVSSDTGTEVFDPDMRWQHTFGCTREAPTVATP